jgi:hypothetical protein
MPCSNHADNSEEDDSTLSGGSYTTAVDGCIAATAEDFVLCVHVDTYVHEKGRNRTRNYISFGIDEEDNSKLSGDSDTTNADGCNTATTETADLSVPNAFRAYAHYKMRFKRTKSVFSAHDSWFGVISRGNENITTMNLNHQQQ